MKTAVYGTGKIALKFLKKVADDEKSIDIEYFVETDPKQPVFYQKKVISAQEMDFDMIDRLIIAVNLFNYESIMEYLKQLSSDWENHRKKIIYYREFFDMEWYAAKNVMPYVSVKTKDNINFITLSKDNIIPNEMIYLKETYSKQMIDIFLELTDKYYGKMGGYFFDLGANIGTTCVYVKKIKRTDLKIIAVEAGKENFNLLRANCILNNVDDIVTEHFALSNQSGTAMLRFEDGNMGGTHVSETNGTSEVVDMVRLDDYIHSADIACRDVNYIWMDVEGFEPNVIQGAWDVLSSHRIAMLHEFSPFEYEKKGTLEWYCNNIGKLYDHFIDIGAYIWLGEIKERSITEIEDLVTQMKSENIIQTDLFLY